MLKQIKEIAREAGRRILDFYNGDLDIAYKSDDSPLTQADKAAHDTICKALSSQFPQIPVISEEGVMPNFEQRQSYERFWLVDPLDGTKEFIKKNGEFTVNIALIERGQSVLGVVGLPTKDRIYSAQKGKGAWLWLGDQDPYRISSKQDFDLDQLVVSMSRSHPSAQLDSFLKTFKGIKPRPLGSSLKFCYIANGEVDFYPRFGPLNEWDTAAAHVVAEESGAAVADLNGAPLSYNKKVMKHFGFIAASSQALLNDLLARVPPMSIK